MARPTGTTDTNKPEEQKQEEGKATDPGSRTPPVAHNAPPTLPQVLGQVTEKMLSALATGSQTEKQQTIQESLRTLRLWYEQQPTDNRKEIARSARKAMENFKLVAEQFYQEMMLVSAQDAL